MKKRKKYKELINPIIFIGTGRSGTTIISETIMKHPELAYPSNYQDWFFKHPFVNMFRFLFDNTLWRIHGQKKQINKVSFLNKIYFKPNECYKMWNYLSGDKIDFSRSFLIEEIIDEERIQFIRNYFYKMVKFQGRKRLALKITGPSRINYLSQIFPDAIFINLKRNEVATISSFLKIGFWKTRGIHQLWWTGAYDENEKEWAKNNSENPEILTAFQLNKINEITKEETRELQQRYLEISYEDFVANPKKIIAGIFDYLNLRKIDSYKFLKNIKIYNRNKAENEYFSKNVLDDIHRIIRR
jgi:hypothetical protein